MDFEEFRLACRVHSKRINGANELRVAGEFRPCLIPVNDGGSAVGEAITDLKGIGKARKLRVEINCKPFGRNA